MAEPEIVEPKKEMLPLKQDFYVPVEMWGGNYLYFGSFCKLKSEAINGFTDRECKKSILKVTINLEDFK